MQVEALSVRQNGVIVMGMMRKRAPNGTNIDGLTRFAQLTSRPITVYENDYNFHKNKAKITNNKMPFDLFVSIFAAKHDSLTQLANGKTTETIDGK